MNIRNGMSRNVCQIVITNTKGKGAMKEVRTNKNKLEESLQGSEVWGMVAVDSFTNNLKLWRILNIDNRESRACHSHSYTLYLFQISNISSLDLETSWHVGHVMLDLSYNNLLFTLHSPLCIGYWVMWMIWREKK